MELEPRVFSLAKTKALKRRQWVRLKIPHPPFAPAQTADGKDLSIPRMGNIIAVEDSTSQIFGQLRSGQIANID